MQLVPNCAFFLVTKNILFGLNVGVCIKKKLEMNAVDTSLFIRGPYTVVKAVVVVVKAIHIHKHCCLF